MGLDANDRRPTGPPSAGSWPAPTTARAGWYPSPNGPGMAYFDGHRWLWTSPNWTTHASPYAWPHAPTGRRQQAAHPTLPGVAGWAMFGIVVASVVAVHFASNFVSDRVNSLAASLAVVVGVVLLGYGPALVWAAYVRRRWGDGTWASVGWRWRWSDLGFGPLAGLLALIAEVVMIVIIVGFDIPSESNVQVDGTGQASTAARIVLVVVAVVIAPVAEELLFRGLFMRSLLGHMRPVVAIVVQGVLFGLTHISPELGAGNVGLVMVLSAVGMVLGAASYLRRSIGTPIIAHAIFNGVAVLLLFLA